jgi:voltage-gated potassium channel
VAGAVTGWRRVLRAVILIAGSIVVYFAVPVSAQDENLLVRGIVALLMITIMTAGVIWQVMLQTEDPDRRVDGLMFAVIASVLVFALAFYRMALTDPGQIEGLETRIDALYFTMTTLLTIGFGDIHAAGQAARVLVIIQMIFNVVILATAATTLTNRIRLRAEQRAEAKRAAAQQGAAVPDQGRSTHRNPT